MEEVYEYIIAILKDRISSKEIYFRKGDYSLSYPNTYIHIELHLPRENKAALIYLDQKFMGLMRVITSIDGSVINSFLYRKVEDLESQINFMLDTLESIKGLHHEREEFLQEVIKEYRKHGGSVQVQGKHVNGRGDNVPSFSMKFRTDAFVLKLHTPTFPSCTRTIKDTCPRKLVQEIVNKD